MSKPKVPAEPQLAAKEKAKSRRPVSELLAFEAPTAGGVYELQPDGSAKPTKPQEG